MTVKYAFMREHLKQFRLTAMCRVLGVNRSGYYAWAGMDVDALRDALRQSRGPGNFKNLSSGRHAHARHLLVWGGTRLARFEPRQVRLEQSMSLGVKATYVLSV